jgi:hypothetical protein
VADFTHALAIDSTFYRAYRARGECLKKLGDSANGEADLRKWESMKDR